MKKLIVLICIFLESFVLIAQNSSFKLKEDSSFSKQLPCLLHSSKNSLSISGVKHLTNNGIQKIVFPASNINLTSSTLLLSNRTSPAKGFSNKELYFINKKEKVSTSKYFKQNNKPKPMINPNTINY
jgi:hypothetical protein